MVEVRVNLAEIETAFTSPSTYASSSGCLRPESPIPLLRRPTQRRPAMRKDVYKLEGATYLHGLLSEKGLVVRGRVLCLKKCLVVEVFES